MSQAISQAGAPEATPEANSNAGSDPAQVQQIVDAALGEISHIATLPEVTIKIIQLVEDPDSTAQDLNKIISTDPALGARILKVVNSAFYGLPGQIGSINRAIVLLGLNAVKNIAIAASLAKLFRGGRISPNFDARELWTHSIGTATCTQLLSDKVGLGLPDEAFLGGLIHNLGVMVEVQACRAKFVEVVDMLQNDEGLTLRQAESMVIGATHEDFGAGLCKAWKFPHSFQYITGFHHRPNDLPEQHRTLTALVYAADIIVAKNKLGWARGTEATEIDPNVVGFLGLQDSHIAEVTEQLPEALDEASALFTLG